MRVAVVAAAMALAAVSCSGDDGPTLTDVGSSDALGGSDEAATPSGTPTSAPATPTTAAPTTSVSESTAEPTAPPSTTVAAGPGATIEAPYGFTPLEAPPGLRACDPAADLVADSTYASAGSPDVRMVPIVVFNVGDTPCAPTDVVVSTADGGLPSGSFVPVVAAEPALEPGEAAVYVITAPAPDTYDDDTIGDYRLWSRESPIPGVRGPDIAFGPRAGAHLAGPIVVPDDVAVPAVFLPSAPGEQIAASTDRVSIHGVGALRFGTALQAVADATGQWIVVTEWNQASDSCGYAHHESGLSLILSGPTLDVHDAIALGAEFDDPTWRTVSGLGVGSTVDELYATLGADRLTTRQNEYAAPGDVDYLFTPADEADQHHGMFFRPDHWADDADSGNTIARFEAGAGIGRLEGCA